jgi:hypothetical protein
MTKVTANPAPTRGDLTSRLYVAVTIAGDPRAVDSAVAA